MRKSLLSGLGILEIEIKGVGLAQLLNEFTKNKINVKKVCKTSDTSIFIRINSKYAPAIFAILQKKCYNYSITRKIGLKYANFGVLIGILVVFCVIPVLSMFCYGVEIASDDDVLVARANEVLTANGLGAGRTWNSLNFAEIEQILREEIEGVGLVNVSRRGGYLYVNFSEATLETPLEPINTTGILANQNGVISRIFVNSGTALVKTGDTVRVGQMLIAPYYFDEEENQVPCEASGNIYLDVWESATIEFKENAVEYAKTGEKITFSRITYGNDVLSDDNSEINFEHYELETRVEYLSNILPIKIEYITYYETTPVSVFKAFKDEEEALIYEARQNVLELIKDKEILDERHTISLMGDTYYITYYLKTEVCV